MICCFAFLKINRSGFLRHSHLDNIYKLRVKNFPHLVLIFGLLFPSICVGQLAENLLIGNAKATSLANAVTADPPGVDSINFNPAGLANVRTGKSGWNREVKFMGIADVSLEGTITIPEADPYSDQYINVNGCVNRCLLGDDPTENRKTQLDKFQAYIPGYGTVAMSVPAIVPNVGFTYRPRPNSKFTWGNTAIVPFSLGAKRDFNDPGVYAGRNVAISRYIFFAPTLAYKINDHWTIGATFAASMMGMNIGMDLRMPNLMVGAVNTLVNDLCSSSTASPICVEGGDALDPFQPLAAADIKLDDFFSPSFNLGVLYEPTAWFSWGLTYRHSTKHSMTGEYELKTAAKLAEFFRGVNELTGGVGVELLNMPIGDASLQSGDASFNLTFPVHIATGISVRLTSRFKVNLDYKWSEYGIWNQWNIVFDDPHDLSGLLALAFPDAPSNALPIERGYEDTGNWAMGITYIYSDRLKIRAGYEHRPDVARREKRDLLLPISDMDFYGFGVSYHWDKTTEIDITVSQVNSSSKIGANESSFTSTSPTEVMALYPGLDIETELNLTMIQLNWSKIY